MKRDIFINLFTFLIILISPQIMKAQSLPQEIYLSADGRMLFTGGKQFSGLYDSTLIRRVDLFFPQSNYWSLLTSNYNSKTYLPATMLIDGKTFDSVGVRFRGQTSYQNVSGQKKSFKLKLDYVKEGTDYDGYNSLKFNNSYEDKSFMREVFYLHQIRKHIPAAKGNYIHLYINNQDWGLYPNIQPINKDFLEEWFLSNDGANWRADASTGPGGGWGDGKAALNYLSADTTTYKSYYTLKSSDISYPWTKLVNVCSALNNVSTTNYTDIANYLDVDRSLWFLASEIAFTDDDSYVMKGKMDYYAYYEPETGRLTPLEYDGNSTFETNYTTSWGPFYNATKVNYPLLYKLLAVPQFRQRYLAHMRTIINEELGADAIASLNNYYSMIDSVVSTDPKKIYTYAQFQSEKTVLINFINNRRTYLLSNSEVAQVAPTISYVNYSNSSNQLWTPPVENEMVNVKTKVTSTSGISQVNLYYATGLVGNFTRTLMYDDGQHNDSLAGDGVYGGTIPGKAAGLWVRYYVEAVANNTAKSVSYFPAGAEHNVMVYIVSPLTSTTDTNVVINEIMASNSSTVTDNYGEYDDWIELYNKSDQDIDIGGYYLTDNPVNLSKWQIPAGTIIPSHGYLIFWADEDSSQGVNHCNFKLSAPGESLMLLNASQELVDSVSWTNLGANIGYARVPNGTGNFVEQAPTFAASNTSVGIERAEMENITDFRMFPNPTTSSVNIIVQNANNNLELGIYDFSGREVFHSALSNNENQIDVSSFKAGIYFIRIGTNTKKLVIL